MLEDCETESQHGDQALPSGEELCVLAQVGDQGHGLFGARGRVVFERCRFHPRTPVGVSIGRDSASSNRATIDEGVTGSRVMVTPNGARASATAFTTAGGAPMAPPSPTPL